MYIVQMADLHIGSQKKISGNEKDILEEAIKVVEENIEETEREVFVCICGDVIDSKEVKKTQKQESMKRYEMASDILNPFISSLKRKYSTVHVGFCLGNHDITHIDEFLEFAHKYDDTLDKNKLERGYSIDGKNNVTVCMINSCSNKSFEYGNINYADVRELLDSVPKKNKIVLAMHHAIISAYAEDSSCLRDATQLIGLINQYNVVAMLNGHIHGGEIFTIGRKCRAIGVGALFSRKFDDVNSQFNIINICGSVKSVTKIIHSADNKAKKQAWKKDAVEEYGVNNFFEGDDIYLLYNELLLQLQYWSVINNMLLCVNCSYRKFLETLENHFYNQKIDFGKKSYTYKELAEEWEKTELPQCLDFNHGMYFVHFDKEKNEKIHGIEEVAKQLKEKPTSNKIVLSTCRGDLAEKMLQNKENIPSLLSVQFSKSDNGDTLFINMYLRALEAGRFLKINICEIGWFLKKLVEENVSFKDVSIAISAFRVQKKDNFNCFMKSKLDQIDDIELDMLVCNGDKVKISQLLDEKVKHMETITNYKGVERIYQAMQYVADHCNVELYSAQLIERMGKIVKMYKQLDNYHHRGSIVSSGEQDIEREIVTGISQIVLELRKENR